MEADSAEDLDTSVKGKQGELIVMGEEIARERQKELKGGVKPRS